MLDFLIQLDHITFDFINQDLSNPVFDWIMPIVRNKKTWIPFYILGAGLLVKIEKKKALLVILFAIASVGIADGLSSHILKPLFERTRPCLLVDFATHVNLVVERCSGAYSFPSSHAANHFALALFLALVYRLPSKAFAFGILFWAGLISFAQVYVGVHFPLDIIAGILVGIVSGVLSYSIFDWLKKKF